MKDSIHYFASLLAIFLMVIVSSCQSAPTVISTPQTNSPSNGNSEVQNISVDTVSAQRTPGTTEEFPLPNCGGTGKLTQSLGTQVSVTKKVEMGATASIKGGGEVGISETAKITLEAAIEAAYKQEYDTANSRLDTISMEAAPKTHVIYTIEWERQEFSSIVTFEFNREMVQTPYKFIMNVPKIAGSREENCANIGSVIPATPISPNQSSVDLSSSTPVGQDGPFRPHYQVVVGDGIFAQGTFSDGMAEYSQDWLWANGHGDIQRIRKEEYPSGCDIARYNTNLIWIAGTAGMQISINDKIVGTYKIADNAHGYIFQYPINMGDKICAVNYRASTGYAILLGPNIYYHYDSYCYRGNC